MSRCVIVFACDDNYALPFSVAVESLLYNKKATTFYEIYCLVPESFSGENLQKLECLKQRYENYSLQFLNVGDAFSDIEMRIDHISYVTYYRLLLPKLLEDVDRCLYLDVDVVIMQDLSELCDIPLNGNFAATVKHPLIFYRNRIGRHNIPSNSYFNAGVLLLDLRLIREQNLIEQFFELAGEDFKIQDQDVLNVAFAGKVLYLDVKYNFMINLCHPGQSMLGRVCYRGSFMHSKKGPVIIHYADNKKPWDYRNVCFEEEWAHYFARSVFSDSVLDREPVHMLYGKFDFIILWLKYAAWYILSFVNRFKRLRVA